MPLIYFWRVRADGHDANATRIEVRKPLLKTPQLGVAEQSPVPAIKNQQRAAGARRALGRRFKKIS